MESIQTLMPVFAWNPYTSTGVFNFGTIGHTIGFDGLNQIGFDVVESNFLKNPSNGKNCW